MSHEDLLEFIFFSIRNVVTVLRAMTSIYRALILWHAVKHFGFVSSFNLHNQTVSSHDYFLRLLQVGNQGLPCLHNCPVVHPGIGETSAISKRFREFRGTGRQLQYPKSCRARTTGLVLQGGVGSMCSHGETGFWISELSRTEYIVPKKWHFLKSVGMLQGLKALHKWPNF